MKLGKLISNTIKVITMPLDIAEIGIDLATGGNGDRKELKNALPCVSSLRDQAAKTIEQIDH